MGKEELLYRKRYFDDIRILQREKEYKRPAPLKRKSNTPITSMLISVNNQLKTFKKLLSMERKTSNALRAEVLVLKERNRKYYRQLENIKRQLYTIDNTI